MTDRVRKVCTRCGSVGRYRPRERRCKVQRYGKGSYCCWGALAPVEKKTEGDDMKQTAKQGRGAAYYQQQYRKSEQQVDACLRRLSRTMTSLRMWQRRERYYAEQMGLSDEQRAELVRVQKEKRKARKAGLGKRKIKLSV